MKMHHPALLITLALLITQCGKKDPSNDGAGECNSSFLAGYYGIDSSDSRESLIQECQGFFDKYPDSTCKLPVNDNAATRMQWKSNEDGSEWTHVPTSDPTIPDTTIYLSSSDHKKKCKNLIIKR